MDIVRIGLDLAKTVFQVHGVGSDDHTLLRKTLSRDATHGISSMRKTMGAVEDVARVVAV
mgnify:CR=1 FL=1